MVILIIIIIISISIIIVIIIIIIHFTHLVARRRMTTWLLQTLRSFNKQDMSLTLDVPVSIFSVTM